MFSRDPLPCFFLLASLLLCSPLAPAQSLTDRKGQAVPDNPMLCKLDTSHGCPGETWVSIIVENASGVAAFSLIFTFNTAVITYQNAYANPFPGLSGGSLLLGNTTPGQLTLAWYSTTAITLPNDTLLRLKFDFHGGISPLAWDENNSSFHDLSGFPIATTFQGGEVSSAGITPLILQQPQDVTAAIGTPATFITAADFTLNYSWQHSTDGGNNWSALPANTPYSGIQDDTLLIAQVNPALHLHQYRCALQGLCPDTFFSDVATLMVSIPFLSHFQENFEAPSFDDSVSSSQQLGLNHWLLDSNFAASGNYSIRAQSLAGTTAQLTSVAFSTVGMTYILLDFKHICHIEALDRATVWVSSDNGTNWVHAGCGKYLCHGLHCADSSFSSTSYPIWSSSPPGQLPLNTWWVQEYFDLSSLLANTPNAMVRLQLEDGGVPGPNGMHGWLVDDLRIIQSSYLGGQVQYASPLPQAFRDSTTLMLNGPVNLQIPTDAGGGFSFINLPPGNYTLTATSSKKAGGWNASDIYMIYANWSSSPPLLNGIYRGVADVNGSGGIPNASDALAISRRFLHQIQNFQSPNVPPPGKPDWFFETIPIGLGPFIQGGNHVRGLCTGDPNASFILFP